MKANTILLPIIKKNGMKTFTWENMRKSPCYAALLLATFLPNVKLIWKKTTVQRYISKHRLGYAV